jgi:hypothetical protein
VKGGTAAEIGLGKSRFQFDKWTNFFQKIWDDTPINHGGKYGAKLLSQGN